MHNWIVYCNGTGICCFAMNMNTGEQETLPGGTGHIAFTKRIDIIAGKSPLGNNFGG